MKSIVTGGAGFIGSHLADSLIEKHGKVLVLDDFSAGSAKNLNKNAVLVKKDILGAGLEDAFADAETVFHFAADPNVRTSATNQKANFVLNVSGTFNVLEACRKADVKKIVFASTSAVYGNAKITPTPESCPTIPISNYAASKLAGEAYCSSYAHTYGIKATVLRLANIFGERSTHGVMFDFYKKMKSNQKKLQILGDGKQNKSYLHVSDCVSATLLAAEKQTKIFDIFNVGSEERHTVNEIAKLVSKEMSCEPKFEYSGGKTGWAGDVPEMLLDVKKLEKLGWNQKIRFGEGIKRYIKWLKSTSN